MGKTTIIAAVAVAAAAIAAPAAAQTTYFNLKSGTNSNLSGAAGNSIVVWNNTGTIQATISAWSLNSATGVATPAYLGRYTNGLGVTSGADGDGQSNNSHSIDNSGAYDFVMFTFSTPVQLLYGSLNPYDINPGSTPADNDPSVSFSLDTITPGWDRNRINTVARIKNDLVVHTTELRGNLSASTSNPANQPYWTNLNPGMNTGNIWTIGADRLNGIDSARDDGFKLAMISVQLPVPEPASWAMMIAGFGLVGGTLRRGRSRPSRAAIA